ncbi:YadA-like family protein [Avibacterium sp. 21-595]|uniref:YadA-like family protein n=1 Tax=Avibacterium sp. 21-595 TaxID=2911527 RepID=UPI0020261044|nr:YadA-like family protein [Avibacterium sp. 21-595]URL06341.1 YadA-like family protein [Avibacterium sp. 21-595]
MNKIFRIIWNHAQQNWVVTSELASRQGKSSTLVDSSAQPQRAVKNFFFNLISLSLLMSFPLAANAYVAIGGTAENSGIAQENAGPINTNNAGNTETKERIATANDTKGSKALSYSNPGNLSYDDPNNAFIHPTTKRNVYSGYLPVATGIAIGAGADATNGDASSGIAIGDYSKASGTLSFALGAYSIGSETGATAIGTASRASGFNSLAMMRQSAATNDYAMAIGNVSWASGKGSLAMGQSSQAAGDRAIAIGSADVTVTDSGGKKVTNYDANTNTQALGDRSIAFGASARTAESAEDSVALGSKTKAQSRADVAMGLGAIADGTTSTNSGAINNTTVTSEKAAAAVALGAGANATGRNAVAIGAGAQADTTGLPSNLATQKRADNVAIGAAAQAAYNAVASGFKSKATGTGSVAIGSGAEAKAQNMIAIGINAGKGGATDESKKNTHGIAIGNGAGQNVISGTENVAIGRWAGMNVEGNTNYAIGVSAGNNVKGADNFAAIINAGQNVEGSQNIALGYYSGQYIKGSSNIAIGKNAGKYTEAEKLTSNNNIAIGTDTKANPGANGNAATAIGANANALANAATALGVSAQALGVASVAIGEAALASAGAPITEGSPITTGATTAVGRQSQATAGSASAFGSNANASGEGATALGNASSASGKYAVASGVQSNASGIQSTAIGRAAQATANDTIAIGSSAKGSAENAIALGINAQALASNAISIGNGNVVTGKNSGAIGDPTTITGAGTYSLGNDNGTIASSDSGVFGNNNNLDAAGDNNRVIGNYNTLQNKASGDMVMGARNTISGATDSEIIGNSNTVQGKQVGVFGDSNTLTENATQSRVLGNNNYVNGSTAMVLANNANVNKASGAKSTGSIAIGNNVTTEFDNSTAIGTNASAVNSASTAIGVSAQASSINALAIGSSSNAQATQSVAVGTSAHAYSSNSLALGTSSSANGASAIAIGNSAATAKQNSMAVGVQANANGNGAAAFGKQANATGDNTVAVGTSAIASTGGSTALGPLANAFGDVSLAVGNSSKAEGGNSMAVGQNSQAVGASSMAVGQEAVAKGNNALALGYQAKAEKGDSLAMGYGAQATLAGSVALGAGSVTGSAVKTSSATVNGITYSGFAGDKIGSSRVLSVGTTTGENQQRQIQNVAAGRITATSTDAINGSQLYMVANTLGNVATTMKNILGGDATLDPATGNITMSNIGGTGKNTIDEAIKAAKTEVKAGTNVANVATSTDTTDGHTIYTVNADGTTVSAGNSEYVSVSAGQKNDQNVTDYAVDLSTKAKESLGKADTALQSWKAQIVNGDNTTEIKTVNQSDSTFSFEAGDNITLANDSGKLKISAPANGSVTNGDTGLVNGGTVYNAIEAAKTRYYSVNDNGKQGANYNNDGATGINALAAGVGAKAAGENVVSIGFSAGSSDANANNSVYIGDSAGDRSTTNATRPENVYIGRDAGKATAGGWNTAIGTQNAGAGIKGDLNVALGHATLYKVTGDENTGLGAYAGQNSTGNYNTSVGSQAGRYIQGSNNTSVGYNAGANTVGSNNVALGNEAGQAVTMNDTVSIGNAAKANAQNGDVALGANAVTATVVGTDSADINGLVYGGFAGNDPKSTVSVGKKGAERTITNVAAGRISKTSTDAINGSQLYAVADTLGNVANSVVSNLGGNAAVDEDGNITMTNIGGTGKDTLDDAIKAVKTEVVHGKQATVTSRVDDKDGHTIYTVNATKTTVAGTGDVVISGDGTADADGVIAYTADLSKDTKDNIQKGVDAKDTIDTLGVNFGGDTGKVFARKLGEQANVKGGASGELTEGNIGVVSNGTDTLTVKLAKDIDLTKEGTLTIGDTVLTNDTIATDSVIANNVNVGGTTISEGKVEGLDDRNADDDADYGVGDNATRAATEGAVKNVDDKFNNATFGLKAEDNNTVTNNLNNTVDVVGADSNITTKVEDSKLKIELAKTLDLGKDGSVTMGDTKVDGNGLTINNGPSITKDGGIDAGNKPITNVASGGNVETNAANIGDVNKAGWNIQGNGTANGKVVNNNTVNFVNGTGTTATVTGSDGSYSVKYDVNKTTFNTDDSGNVSAVDTGDNFATAKDVADAINNAQKTVEVAAGTNIASVESETEGKKTTFTVNAKGTTVTEGDGLTVTSTDAGNNVTDYSVALSDKTKEDIKKGVDAKDTIDTLGVNFGGDTGKVFARKLGEQANVKGGASGELTEGNIGVVSNGTDTLTVKLAKDIDLTKEGTLTIGDTVLTNDTIATDSVIANNVNVGGTTISEGKVEGLDDRNADDDADYGVGDNATRAATEGAVKNVDDKFNNATFGLKAEDNNTVTNNLNNTVDVVGADSNITTKVEENKLKIELAKTLDLGKDGSVTMGDTKVDGNGLTINNGPSITKDGGIDAGNKPITNVASGGDVETNAANIGDVNKAGWNIQGNGTANGKVVNNNTVNFVNGTGTTATVTGSNGSYSVKYDVNKTTFNTDDSGNVSAVDTGDNFATAKDVADAINNAQKTVEVAAGTNIASVESKTEGKKTTFTVNAKGTTVSVSDELALTTDSETNKANNITDYKVALSDKTKEEIKKGVDAKDAVDTKGVGFAGDSGDAFSRKLGEQTNVKGGVTDETKLTDNNIGVVSDGKDTLTVKLAKDLKDLNSISANTVTAGDTTMTTDGITISNGTKGNPVSLTKDGLDNGGNQITNVASGGDVDTNAANIGDIKSAVNKGGWNIQGNGTPNGKVVNNNTVNFVNGTGTTATVTGSDGSYSVKYDVNKTTFNTDDSGNVSAVDTGDNFATAKDVADAINNAQKTVEVAAGTNIASVESETEGKKTTFTVNAKGTTVTEGDGLTVTPTDAGNNVTDYSVALSDKTKEDIKKGVDAKDAVDTKGVGFAGDSGDAFSRKLGEQTNVKGGVTDETKLTDNNIGVVSDGKDTLTVKLAKDLKDLNSVSANTVAAGDTTMTTDGITINNGKAGKPVSLTKDGLDNGGNQIKNVASGGDVDTNAANIGDIKSAVNKGGWNIQGNGKANGKVVNDNTVNFVNGTGTTATVTGSNGSYSVKYDVNKTTFNTDDSGNVSAVDTGDNFATAKDVADAINNAQKTVEVAAGTNIASVESKTEGKKTTFTVNAKGTTVSVSDELALTTDSETNKANNITDYKVALSDKTKEEIKKGVDAKDAVDTKGVGFAGDSGDAFSRKLGEQTNVKGGVTDETKLTDNNIGVVSDGKDTLTVKLAKDLKDLNSISANTVTAGDTTMTTDGITISNGTKGNPVSLTKDGLDNGGNQITNVASGGDVDTNAANIGDIKSAVNKGGWNIQGNGTPNGKVVNNNTVNFVNGTGTTATVTGSDGSYSVKYDVNKTTFNTDDSGNVSAVDTGDNFATAKDVADAINNAQKTVEVAAGTNIASVESETEGKKTTFTVNAKGTTVTEGDGLTVTPTDAGNNVTDYSVALSDKTKEDIKKGVDAKDAVDTKGVGFAGDSGDAFSRKLGEQTNVKGGVTDETKLTDNNIGVVSDGKDTLTVKLAKDLKDLNSVSANTVAAGDTTMTTDGITISNGTKGNPVSLTKDGLDNGGNQIKNVASGGDVDTNAANIGDLKNATSNLVNKGFNIAADDGNKDNVKLGETVKFTDPNGNIVTTVADNEIKLALNKDLTVGDDKEPGTITVKGENDKDGVSLNGKDGSIGLNGKDGANGTITVKQGKPGVDGKDGEQKPRLDINGEDVATLNDGLKFQGNNDTTAAIQKKLNETLTIKGENAGDDVSATNMYVENSGSELIIKMAKALTDLTSATFTTPDGNTTVVNNNGVTITPKDGQKKPVSLTDAGLDNGGNQITNVASGGTVETNAANIGDLKNATSNLVNTGFNIAADNGNKDNVKLGETVKFTDPNGNIVTTVADNEIKLALNKDLTVGDDKEPGTITVKGENGKDGVSLNGKDGSIGLNGKDGASGTITVKQGKSGVDGKDGEQKPRLDINGEDVATLNDGLKFAGDKGDTLIKKLNETVTIKGKAQADADVTDKNLRVDSENGELVIKMAKALTDLTSVATGDTLMDNNGVTINNGKAGKPVSLTKDGLDNGGNKITNVAAGTDAKDAVNVSQLEKAQKAATTKVVEGKNIKVTETKNTDGSKTYTVATADDLDVNSVKAGDTVLNKQGVKVGDTVLNKDGVKVGDKVALTKDGLKVGGVNISTDGINAGNKKVTGVANGDISATSQDAVNGSQLYTVQQAAKAAKTEVEAGDNIKVTSKTGGNGQTVYTVATKKEVNFDQVNVGGVSINKDTGINAGNKKVTGVLDGNINADSTDAVNGRQLHKTDQNVAENAANIANNTATINKGLNFTADDGQTLNRKLGDTVAVNGDENIKTSVTSSGVKVALNKNLKVDSITAGNTVVNNEGVTIGSGNNAVSLTQNGLNNGGNRITNVAPGTAPTDAVNVAQLSNVANHLDNKVNKVAGDMKRMDKKLRAGIAGAAALGMLPQPTRPGKSMVSVGGTTYRNESAVALGVSRVSDNEKWVIKVGASANTRNNYIVGGSVGYQW